MILIDAGPLVGVLHRDDAHHEGCVATTWPVISEVMHLLSFSWEAQDALWDQMIRNALHLPHLNAGDVPRMRQLMQRYRDVPMDPAGAALVRIAEREGIRRILTLDRRDFALYRPAGVGRFEIIP